MRPLRPLLEGCVLSPHEGIEPVGEVARSGLGGVLVDQGSAHRRVAHPVHEFSGRRTGLRNEVVTRVAQVVKVESLRETRRPDGIAPADVGTPVAPTRCRAPLPREHQRVLIRRHLEKVTTQLRDEDIGEGHNPNTVVLRRRGLQPSLVLDQTPMDNSHTGIQINVTTA